LERLEVIKLAMLDWDTLSKTVIYALPELQHLYDQGYTLTVISHKVSHKGPLDTLQEYRMVVKNYPLLATLISENQVFSKSYDTSEVVDDLTYRQALAAQCQAKKIIHTAVTFEILIVGNATKQNVQCANDFYQTLFSNNQTHFIYNNQVYPVPDPFNSQISYALFNPQRLNIHQQITRLKVNGISAFAVDSWKMLILLLAGGAMNKPVSENPLTDAEIMRLTEQYNFKDQDAGFYMLRAHPRRLIEVTKEKNVIISDHVRPLPEGSATVTFVDVKPELEEGRQRFYPQKLFVHRGKVFNAAAYLVCKNKLGEIYMLLVKDQRNWNVPIGRVDHDELIKQKNQPLLNLVRGRGLANIYCILAAIRELHEEAGVSIDGYITKQDFRIIAHSSDVIDGNVLSPEKNYATTVTTQVIIDLGVLQDNDIQNLEAQFKTQSEEHIEQVRLIPVELINQENTSTELYFWQARDTTIKHPIFKHVGRVIAALRSEKLMPFDQQASNDLTASSNSLAPQQFFANTSAKQVITATTAIGSTSNKIR
jgi:8-oxo-dGTP pyrophosphatase MutT (NUDIX family)